MVKVSEAVAGSIWTVPDENCQPKGYLPGYLEGSHTFYFAPEGSFSVTKSSDTIKDMYVFQDSKQLQYIAKIVSSVIQTSIPPTKKML